jgi:hypothetical protein
MRAKGGPDGNVWVLDNGTNKRLMRFDVGGTYIDDFVVGTDWAGVEDFDFTADEVLVAMKGGIRRYDLQSGSSLGNVTEGLEDDLHSVHAVLALPDGRVAAVMNNKLRVLASDFSSFQPVANFSSTAKGLVYASNGTVIGVAATDAVDAMVIWDPATEAVTHPTFVGSDLRGIAALDSGELVAAQASTDFSVDRLRKWTAGSTAIPVNLLTPTTMRRLGRAEIAPGFFAP